MSHFAEIQEDIRALWSEIQAHEGEQQTNRGPYPTHREPIQTQDDGPSAIYDPVQQIGPQREYFGMGLSTADVNEPSLPDDPMDFLTTHLTPIEIQKAKQACRGSGHNSNMS